MQHALKSSSGAARAQIVATELLDQLDIAMDETPAALRPGFRGERLPPLTCDLESNGGLRYRDACAWHASIKRTAHCRAPFPSFGERRHKGASRGTPPRTISTAIPRHCCASAHYVSDICICGADVAGRPIDGNAAISPNSVSY
jgi:hypothetical protein